MTAPITTRSCSFHAPRPKASPGALLLLLLLCTVAFLAPVSPLHGAQAPTLFLESETTSADRPPGKSRERRVTVDRSLLTSATSPLRSPSARPMRRPTSRIVLNFFADAEFIAHIEHTDIRSPNRMVIKGSVEDSPGSVVLMAVSEDAVAATVAVPGRGVFRLQAAGDGDHKVFEVDPDAVPPCGPETRVPSISPPLTPADSLLPDVTPPAPAVAGDYTTIDIMVVYTAAARVGAGGTAAMNALIDLAVEEANTCYQNSQITARLNLIHRAEVAYTESGNANTDLTRLQATSDGQMDVVHTLRTQYGADVVCLFTETMASYAGLGYIMAPVSSGFAPYPFSVVKREYAVGYYTFAHEVGHNLGCTHDRANASSSPAYPYSYGHRFYANNVQYRTVMAYAPGNRIPYFSNPNVSYLGTPTGVAAGLANAANNALSINNAAPVVANFRGSVAQISLSSSAQSLNETDGSVSFTVTRTGGTNTTATVQYATANGTASSSSDYTPASGTLTFDPGETNQTITLTVSDDLTHEANETFTLNLSSPVGAALATRTATVTILDDDRSFPAFSTNRLSVTEADGSVSITVLRSGSTNSTAYVRYSTSDLTANSGADFSPLSGLLSFLPGEDSKSISLSLINDRLNETNEAFNILLHSTTNCSLGPFSNLLVTIRYSDASPLNLSTNRIDVSEASGSASFSVRRSGLTNTSVSVDYFTTNLSAIAGTHYSSTSGTLSFAPGETLKSVSVPISDNDLQTPSKSFSVRLANPSDATLGPVFTNIVVIADNDASSVAFSTNAVSISETADSVELTLIRSGASSTSVSVNFSTTNITASSGSDYSASSGTVTFDPDDTSKTISIPLSDDSLHEPDQSFRVLLSSPVNTSLANASATVTILDDDRSFPAFSTNRLSVTEADGSVSITVLRSGSTNSTAYVRYSTSDLTANSGADFSPLSGLLSFLPGEDSKSISLSLINDRLNETNEAFNILLHSTTNCSLGAFSNLLVTIRYSDASPLNLSTNRIDVSEASGSASFSVRRSGLTNTSVSVDYFTTNLSAIAGTHYSSTSGTLSFAPGETLKSVSVPISDNDLQTPSKSFSVRLANPSDATLGTVFTNIVVIADNDASSVAFSTNAVSISETADSVELTLVRSGAASTSVSVNFSTTNVTASSGSDYSASSGTVTFDPDDTSKTISIPLSDDSLHEPDQSFRVLLSTPVNTSLANASATVTILDDDRSFPAFSTNRLSVTEADGSLSITVLRSGSTNSTAYVRYSTSDLTANSGADFSPLSGLLSFLPGEDSKSISLSLINDRLNETNEAFNILLHSTTNCSLGAFSNLLVTIRYSDASPLNLSTNRIDVSEASGSASFSVRRSGLTNTSVSVDYFTTNLSAIAGTHYSSTSGTLSFAPGETLKSVSVPISDNDLQTPSKSFSVRLANPSDATLGPVFTNIVVISDNDASSVAFSTNAVSISETADSVELTLIRSGASSTSVSVNFSTTNVTASSGSDYSASSGTVTFDPDDTSKTISIPLSDDSLHEPDQSFRVLLSTPVNTSLANASATVTILDDDRSFPAFSTNRLSVTEADGSVSITVLRSGSTNSTAYVRYSTSDLTANSGADFSPLSGLLSFLPGEDSKSISLSLINDRLNETNEAFNILLHSTTNCSLGAFSNLLVTIRYSDASPLNLSTNRIDVSEASGSASFSVRRSGLTNTSVSVDYFTTNLSAIAGTHYSSTSGTLSFAPGETLKSVSVPISDNDLQTPSKSFSVRLANPSDATLGPIFTNIVVISDNDASSVGFVGSTASVAEDAGNLAVEVRRSGATNTTISLTYLTVNGAALAGTDFISTNGLLTFSAGETQKTVVVAILADALTETNETFRLRLASPTNTSLGLLTNLLISITPPTGGDLAPTGSIVLGSQPVALQAPVAAPDGDAPPPNRFVATIASRQDGFVSVEIQGHVGTSFVLLRSDDLLTWWPAVTNTLLPGPFTWSEPLDTNIQQRFFRVEPYDAPAHLPLATPLPPPAD